MSAATASSGVSKRAPSQVIEMFQALRLPVTDDEIEIAKRADELRPQYQREKNNPDPHTRARAERWYKDLVELQQGRDELLAVVYRHFSHLADVSLRAARAANLTTLSKELYDELEKLAVQGCNCIPKVAQRFVDQYLLEHGIIFQGPIARPGYVDFFHAKGSQEHIRLEWSLPVGNWDEIELIRREASRKGRAKAKENRVVISHSNPATALEEDVEYGIWYEYTLYVSFGGVKETSTGTRRAIRTSEIQNLRASYSDGKVNLSWDIPTEDIDILVFRCVDGAPDLNFGLHGPEPVDKTTEQMPFQSIYGLDDTQIAEDVTYTYRVLVNYDGIFTLGRDVSIHIPRTPPPVSNVSAHHKQLGSANEVELEWSLLPEMVEYVVLRREGEVAPVDPQNSLVSGVTRESRFIDRDVEAGHRYTYAVFTRNGEIYSKSGAASKPVTILSEVTELRYVPGDGTVELSWQPPANTKRIIIVRQAKIPKNGPQDGTHVKPTGPGNALDNGLINGEHYHYLVCCAYRPSKTGEVITPGIPIEAIPDRLPEALEQFSVREENWEVLCDWVAPAYGQVVVIRSEKPSPWEIGVRLTVREMESLGERIPTETLRAVDRHPNASRPYYSAFSVTNDQAISGGCIPQVVVPDVTNLTLTPASEGIVLRWTWPPGCKAVQVVRCLDQWSHAPDDPQGVCFSCTHWDYVNTGEKFVDAIQQGGGRYHYTVYALASGAPGQFFSPGREPTCRAQFQWAQWMTLSYWFSPARNRFLHLTWTIQDMLPGFGGFVLVANEAHPPLFPEDGMEIFRWTPNGNVPGNRREADVSLATLEERGWENFYCKLMIANPVQRQGVLVIHPNTSQSITRTGKLPAPPPANSRMYRPGIPDTFVCPICFSEHPLEEMEFTDFGGGPPVKANYSRMDRLLRRPIQPPPAANRPPLHRKVCPTRDPDHPERHHYLPYTAGTQESLVIGVIGAKFSGKSHYIAALIDSLENKVAFDLKSNLLAVTDETTDRYQKEFHDPLFRDGIELRTTLGTPPPLIYDLQLQGELFHEKRPRAVTLALYDTAGENFDNPETVRQMMKYLKLAAGVIFLVDPLQSPGVRQLLPSTVPLPNVDLMAEPSVVLQRVLTELENNRVLTRSGPLSIPVAVVLTKCDVLRDHGLIESNRLWNTDKRHVNAFNVQYHEDMNAMMAEKVQQWSPKAYATASSRFLHHAFFGVSATGCASDKMTHRYKYISPWRVEDPLLWLLAELGVIPSHDPRKH